MMVSIEVKCIGCNHQWSINHTESKRLSKSLSVPMCEKCGMPAIAVLAEGELNDRTDNEQATAGEETSQG
jgi:NAD-dependent SIR2 family protein deacetylase